MLKLFFILFVIIGAYFVYNNVDFSKFKDDTTSTIRQEKTMKKFFDADRQNKEETQRVIQDY